MLTDYSINALIQLIEDPDENVFQQIRKEIIHSGVKTIPLLENSLRENDYGLLFQERIEELISEIQNESNIQELKDWKSSEEKDLLKGAIIIAKFCSPHLDEKKIYATVNSIHNAIWLEVSENMTCFEQIHTFNKVFFQDYGFYGDIKTPLSVENSMINRVVETKKGNPLSLSLLYSVIAQRLNLPIYGVKLPNQFVLTYAPSTKMEIWELKQKGLEGAFYINAFSQGEIFDKKEIKRFLKTVHQSERPEFFEPCPNSSIIKQMLKNLANGFAKKGNSPKAHQLNEICELVF